MLITLVIIRNDKGMPPVDVEPNGFNSLDRLAFLYVDDHRMCCFFETLDSCTTLEPQPPLFMCGSLMQNLLLRVSMWILGISALFGNLYALIWRLKEKTRSPTQAVQSFLIGNLAASDFLMGIYMMIIAGADLYYGDEYFVYSDQWRTGNMCRFAGFVSLLSSEGSVFFLTLISVDRLISVVMPFSDYRLSPKWVKLVGAILWTISAILSIVPTVLAGPESDFYDLSDVCIGLPLITRPASYSVMTDAVGGGLSDSQEFSLSVPEESKPAWYFSIVIFLGVNLVCFFVIAICYIVVFISLQKSSARLHGRKGRRQREERRLAIRMAVIVGTDFICWTPVIIMGILSQTGAAVIPLEMYTWSVVFILPINSSLNPYLYTLHSLFVAHFQKQNEEQSQGQSLMDRSRADDKGPEEPGPSGTLTMSLDKSDENASESGHYIKNKGIMGIKLRPLQILMEKVSSSVGSNDDPGPSTVQDQELGKQKSSVSNMEMDYTNTQLPGSVNHQEIDSD
ncbi:G-protein coupled receptor GRL101-like [Amphiura filiformis]|uniref:G-protein coupled receptor GRL101-like n=1 Tax=Amphiura filiformis TaxID=82378 RepID=UPI003B228802